MLSSLFKSNDSSSPEFQALVTRWDNFLVKLKERYHEILQQADDPLENVISNIQYDTVIIHNIKTGLYNQAVEQLSKRADEGWNKMEGEMGKIGVSRGLVTQQHSKADAFKETIANEFKYFEVSLYGKAARQILKNVRKHIDENKIHSCTQCGALLPIKIYSFMSVNLKCESCGSVNTYKPDDRIRALEYYVINHLAEEQAFPAKLKAKYDKNSQEEYFKTYYGFLMDNVPDKKDFYQREMDERINNPIFSMTF